MTENQQQQDNGQQQQQQAPARPEHIPEKYWDAKNPLSAEMASHPTVMNLAKGYGEATAALGRNKEGFRAEFETERFKNRPATPAEYKVGVPKEGPLAEAFGKKGIVLMTEKPAEGFKPEPGKTYHVVNPADPLWNYWRGTAHAMGLSNDQFMEGVLAFAESQGTRIPTEEQAKAEKTAFYTSLGEHGAARVDHLWGQLKATLGDQRAAALDDIVGSKEGVEALEALMEKAGAPKFAPTNAGVNIHGDPKKRYDELRGLQTTNPDKYFSKEVQDELAAIGKKLFPGVQGHTGGSQAA